MKRMKQLQDAETNVGRQRIYLYHMKTDNKRLSKPKRYQKNAELWFPDTAASIRLSVLKKLYDLSGGTDSVDIVIDKFNRYEDCYLLYLSDMFVLNSDGIYVFNEDRAIEQTKSRFDDFVNNGFITGKDYGHVQLTLTGRNEMERLLSLGDISAYADALREIKSKCNEESDIVKLQETVSVITEAKSAKISVRQVLSDLANISSILNNSLNVAPTLFNVACKSFSFIRSLLTE